MTSEWRTEPLQGVVSYIAKGIPPAYVEVESENTVHVLNQKCNRDFAISYTESRLHDLSERSVPQEKYLRNEDILINSTGTGTAGRIAQLHMIPCPTIVDGHMIVLRGNEKVTPRYLGYALKAQQATVLQLDEGSTGQTELNRDRLLAEIAVSYPVSLAEQDAIVSILSALDDRIEANSKINHHLEQMAQAIFKSWFVDFEPSFIRLGEVCQCVLGGTPSRAKPEYWGGSVPWINSGKVNEFRITKPNEWITETGLKNSATKLLPAKTTVLAITGATLGQVSLLEIEACANQSVVGIVSNEILPYTFIYPFIVDNIDELISHQTGGAQQHINKQNIESLEVPCYPEEVIAEYDRTIAPIFEQISNNCFESVRLAELRDTILPRLMSGELSVADL